MSDTNAPLDLDELQRLADAATPGPWEWMSDDEPRLVIHDMDVTDEGRTYWAGLVIADFADSNNDHDGEFVRSARTAVPALIAMVRERDAEIERLWATVARVEALRDLYARHEAHNDDPTWKPGVQELLRRFDAALRGEVSDG